MECIAVHSHPSCLQGLYRGYAHPSQPAKEIFRGKKGKGLGQPVLEIGGVGWAEHIRFIHIIVGGTS
jgi:hypothetical protein